MAGLITGLFSTKKICRIKHDQLCGWKILGTLLLFFVAGYLIFYFMIKDKTIGPMEILISMVLGGGGVFVLLVTRMSMLTIQNVNRIAALERHRSLHDELTDLPNRTLLYERIYYGIMEAEKRSEPLAVLMLDLDRFKEINDALGHHYGDHLLQMIGERLQKIIRENDTVSRLGGDEFAIVLPGVGLEQAKVISEKIAKSIEKSFIIEGRNLKVKISTGVALYPVHGKDSETLLQRADVAMYAAKRNKTGFTVYKPEYDEYTIKRLVFTEELRKAIKEGELFLQYQPIFDIKEDEIYGVEALVRWRHPDHSQVISPEDFIYLAEQTGLIEQLTVWVLQTALEQMSIWHAKGFDINTSINLSARSLHDPEFPRLVEELLKKWHVQPAMLTFEITESCMMTNPKISKQVIASLHAQGINFSIDDFGTGFFPFESLKQFPVKAVKIDKSFVQGMLNDENDTAIVRATIDLANGMGLKPIAEGIETRQLAEITESLGCFTLQGFYLCQPIYAEELLTLLDQKKFILNENASAQADKQLLAYELGIAKN